MRHAFTMIELIFIIVILGILATVLIPKLAVTRTDAIITTKAQAIITASTDIASFTVATGNVDSNMSNMSNTIYGLVNSGEAVLANNKATISIGSTSDCIVMETVGVSDKNLTLSFGNANGDNICTALQSLIDLDTYPITLQGSSVVY